MAEQFLYFVWDETKNGWVPFNQSAISLTGNKVFPKQIINIRNAKRVSQFGLEALQIPATEWKKEGGKSFFEPITPISPDQEPETKLKLKDVVSFVPSAAAAYERWRTSENPLQVGTPGTPGLITSPGVKTKGVTEDVRKFVKSIFSTSAISVEINAPLPGEPNYVAPGGLATTGVNESTKTENITDKAKVSQRLMDLYGDSRQAQSSPMEDLLGGGRQRIRTFIDLPQGSAVERKSNNVFSVNGVDSIFIYDRENNQLKPESVDAFYTGLYNLRPNEIAGFKRALGYSAEDANGILTDKFKDDLFDAAKAVSEYNYGYAQSGLKLPVDLAKYLQTPQAYPEISSMIKQQKSGGAGGGGAAIDANRLAANVDTVRLLETELGVSLSKQQRDKIARDLATGRVNATTLPSTIASAGKLSLDEGEAASIKAELKQIAAANGVDLGEAWFDNTTRNILQGKMARETANTEILRQAKMKYAAPSLVAGLDAGFTIRDQVTQNINWLAQMRGVDPESISLNDPILAKALVNINDQGMPVQMDFMNWENYAKENDPMYATSSMAEEQYSSALRVMGQAFGRSI